MCACACLQWSCWLTYCDGNLVFRSGFLVGSAGLGRRCVKLHRFAVQWLVGFRDDSIVGDNDYERLFRSTLRPVLVRAVPMCGVRSSGFIETVGDIDCLRCNPRHNVI